MKSLVHFLLLGLVAFGVQDQPSPKPAPSVHITRLTISNPSLSHTFGGIQRNSASVQATIDNQTDRPINSLEIQVDIVDPIRRVVRERLFIKLDDPGLGDRSIKPGKSRSWNVDLGDYRLPESYATYGVMDCNSECLQSIRFNVITFKDKTVWERPSWRDEPNPNKK